MPAPSWLEGKEGDDVDQLSHAREVIRTIKNDAAGPNPEKDRMSRENTGEPPSMSPRPVMLPPRLDLKQRRSCMDGLLCAPAPGAKVTRDCMGGSSRPALASSRLLEEDLGPRPESRLAERGQMKDLEIYVKDTQWVTEKSMMVQEKSFGLLEAIHAELLHLKSLHFISRDMPEKNTAFVLAERSYAMLHDMHQDHVRAKEGQRSQVEAKQAPPFFDKDHMDQTIRDCVTEALLSMETKMLNRTSHFLARAQFLPAEKTNQTQTTEWRNVEDYPTALDKDLAVESQQESMDKLARGHAAALDMMSKRIDELSGLVRSLDSLPGKKQLASKLYSMTPEATSIITPETTGITDLPQDVTLGKDLGQCEDSQNSAEAAGGKVDTALDAGQKYRQIPSQPEEEEEEEKALQEPLSPQSAKSPKAEAQEDEDVDDGGKHFLTDEEEEELKKTRIQHVVGSKRFEMIFAALIVLNTANMCIECEYTGWHTGASLGVPGLGGTWSTAGKEAFQWVELAFAIVFTFEVVIKLVAYRCKFFKSAWNVFDFCIIGCAWFDLVAKVDLFINPMLLRLVRLVRLARLLRGLNAFEVFDNLNLMVRGIKAAAPVLLWVVVLVYPMIACCALGMNYTVVDFMNDDSQDLDERLEAYAYFGTFTKAFLSMFEVTFANWAPICRFLYVNVDQRFALFFMVYKLVMGIAVLRIIYGVFLHVTFACATSDEEMVITKKNRENKKYSERLHTLFKKFDESGDGYLTKHEFLQVMRDQRVKTLLAALELEIDDAALVFDLTDDGDGRIGAEEMVYSFSRLKGNARSVDILALTKLVKDVYALVDRSVLGHKPTHHHSIANEIMAHAA